MTNIKKSLLSPSKILGKFDLTSFHLWSYNFVSIQEKNKFGKRTMALLILYEHHAPPFRGCIPFCIRMTHTIHSQAIICMLG